MFTDDLQFCNLCGIHESVALSKIYSLRQTNARDFMQLRSTINDISYPFKQEEHHVFFLMYNYVTTPLLLQ